MGPSDISVDPGFGVCEAGQKECCSVGQATGAQVREPELAQSGQDIGGPDIQPGTEAAALLPVSDAVAWPGQEALGCSESSLNPFLALKPGVLLFGL